VAEKLGRPGGPAAFLKRNQRPSGEVGFSTTRTLGFYGFTFF
jgi:hypothetical protein